jgi:uncharacterized protein YlxP (DUF503 family)
MVVGTLRARLLVREARSLKDKRQVVRSVVERLRQRYNVSAAEVDAQDKHQLAVIGVAMIGDEPGVVRLALQQIAELLRGHPVAEYLGGEIEV